MFFDNLPNTSVGSLGERSWPVVQPQRRTRCFLCWIYGRVWTAECWQWLV